MVHGDHSKRDGHQQVVVTSLVTNVLTAAVRAAGAAVTGSGALLAGAVQAATSGSTPLVLLAGDRRTRRVQRSLAPRHPYASQGERLFWAFVVGALLAAAGGLVVTYIAVDRLRQPLGLTDPEVVISISVATVLWNVVSVARSAGALAASTGGLERSTERIVTGSDTAAEPGVTAPAGVVPWRGSGYDTTWWNQLRYTRRPELVMATLGEVASMVGSVAVAAAATAAILTGDPVFDTAGMLAVGCLMSAGSILQLALTKEAVVGHAAAATSQQAIAAALEIEPSVMRLQHLETYHLGPDELLVAAKVDLIDGLDLVDVAETVQRLKGSVRRAVPAARVLYLEPDVCRTTLPKDLDSPSMPKSFTGP